MLVIISDLHLTDGSTALNAHGSAFELLCDEIVAAATGRTNGGRDKATDIEIVLLGDSFDLVRTDFWQSLPREQRPWNGKLSTVTGMNPDDATNERHAVEALRRICANDTAQVLKRVVNGLSDRADKPVRIRYVIGNHDRLLHNYPALQRQVEQFFAPTPLDFAVPHFADERYGLVARHGHEWDEHCHGADFARVLQGRKLDRFDPAAYRIIAIGEVITAELMSGLVHRARAQLDAKRPLDRQFLRALQDVNNLRPITDVVEWITWLTEAQSKRFITIAGTAFREALDATLESDVAKQWDRLKPDFLVSGDITDYLDKARRVLKGRNGLEKLQEGIALLEAGQRVVTRVVGSRDTDDLVAGAREEFGDALAASAQYVVYGHTHRPRQDYFAATRDGGVKMYINTGTFMPVIVKATDNRSFAKSHRLSFVCVYHNGEDTRDRRGDGPTIDIWDGVKRKEYLEA